MSGLTQEKLARLKRWHLALANQRFDDLFSDEALVIYCLLPLTMRCALSLGQIRSSTESEHATNKT